MSTSFLQYTKKYFMQIEEFQKISNTYKNGEERGRLKEHLITPEMKNDRKTIVFSTPLVLGGL